MLLEAMAAGRPQVVTDVGGNREAVGDAGAALVVAADDAPALAREALRVLGDPDLAESMNPHRVKQRLQAMQLIQPDAMGRRFKVLVLAKDCEPPPELDGLKDPFAR